ncbi:calcium uniporter protein, mitochondrial-like isoform X2 [Xenia sp. Carnegie-2017]|uniref:calcium uniporter protein, mitochondrial-like isoform X2 n=1 Tax=Xenia sp. Carnegie-2017 TaxID=2897299 RepID=UPI001F033918|nr:calcium uniporter protein, mitochondrial-like isoform X2 [Xenia sp. Carnegie-2017]
MAKMLPGKLVRKLRFDKPATKVKPWAFAWQTGRLCFSTTTSRLADLDVELKRGQPVVSIPLPSTNQPCEFTLYETNSVKNLLESIKDEDEGVNEALVHSLEGIRISQNTRMSSLLSNGFKLKINDEMHTITPSSEVGVAIAEESLEDVRELVEKLYIGLDVQNKKTETEEQLIEELEKVQSELEPLEQQRIELEKGIESRTNMLVWGGLAFMAVQFGFLARLTWWEYSWDIMEPVTYFVTYGTSMAFYAYFVLTRQEFMYPEARNRQFLISFHKKAKRRGFDVEKYNHLREMTTKLEAQLEELSNPIKSSNE